MLVSTGGAHFAQAFAEDQGFDGVLLVDEARTAYKAAAMTRSVASTFGLAAMKAGARATAAGFRQGRTQGDPWQQGGVLVVRPGGVVRMAHISRHAGDHPDERDVLRAAEASHMG